MKFHSLISHKKKEEHIINLSSAENLKRVASFNVYFVQSIIHKLDQRAISAQTDFGPCCLLN